MASNFDVSPEIRYIFNSLNAGTDFRLQTYGRQILISRFYPRTESITNL